MIVGVRLELMTKVIAALVVFVDKAVWVTRMVRMQLPLAIENDQSNVAFTQYGQLHGLLE